MKFAHPALIIAVLALAGCPPHDDDATPKSSQQPIETVDCFACGSWTNLGEQQALCDPPSLGLWLDLEACLRRAELDPLGGCASSCASYLLGLDACAASGSPSCAPPTGSNDCNACLESNIPYTMNAPYFGVFGIGCGAYAAPCSEDRTGCASCSVWIAAPGKNSALLCPESFGPAIDISACACQGACAGPCAPACGSPYAFLDPRLADPGCRNCLQHPNKCESTYVACLAN